MKLVVFGLTISSSWGNGHATLWRGLCRAFAERSHEVWFFEKDVPYYESTRDFDTIPGGRLVLYRDFESVRLRARDAIADADVAIVTSYCPDAVVASELVLGSGSAVTVFYDLDTPVTLAALEAGRRPDWIGERGLSGFDLVLSFTGGPALRLLAEQLSAERVAPLYGSVDASVHRPAPEDERFRGSLSYLGTYSADRRAGFEELFLACARHLPEQRFVLGGAMYPEPWTLPSNVSHFEHVPAEDHAAFFSSSRFTLNVTRGTMARFGYCPSGRLFEAACAGAPIVSDWFEGLDQFFEPGRELCVARTSEDVLAALEKSPEERAQMARRARDRTLAEHTAERRVRELERLLEGVRSSLWPPASAAATVSGGSEV